MLSLKQAIQSNINAALRGVYTSIPASIIDYDPDTQTATVQPLINYTWADGVVQEDPPVANVPVMFPGIGEALLSFPVNAGDIVLLSFCMRSVDEWKEGSGVASTPKENRSHELSDAVAIVGLFPKQKTLSPDPDNVELKYKGNKITLKPNGDVVIEGGRIELGDGATESVVLGDALKTYLDGHTHSNGNNGSPTGTPIVKMPASALSTKVKVE